MLVPHKCDLRELSSSENIYIITLHGPRKTSVQTIQTCENLIISSEHAWQAGRPTSRKFPAFSGRPSRTQDIPGIGTCALSGNFNVTARLFWE